MAHSKLRRHCVTLGQAAEYRVLSELLARGVVPSRPCADVDGIDVVVGGLTVQVKTAHTRGGKRFYSTVQGRGPKGGYKGQCAADIYVFVDKYSLAKFWIATAAELSGKPNEAMRDEWRDRWDRLVKKAAA